MTCDRFTNPAFTRSDFALSSSNLTNIGTINSELISYENRPSARYNANTIIANIALTTQIFNALSDKESYPMTQLRLSQGPILVEEYADFLASAGLTETIVNNSLLVDQNIIAARGGLFGNVVATGTLTDIQIQTANVTQITANTTVIIPGIPTIDTGASGGQPVIVPGVPTIDTGSTGTQTTITSDVYIPTSDIVSSNTTLTSSDLYSVQQINYLSQLEYYYNDNMSSSIAGGFCSAFYDVLNTLSELQSLANSVAGLIDDIVNFQVTDYLSTFSQINSILSVLINDLGIKELEKLQNTLLLANEKVLQTIGAVQRTIGFAQLIERRIQQAQAFFSEENLNNIKKNVEALISAFASNYEEITPEVLAYLMHRFCQLVEAITNFMQMPVNNINDLLTKFDIAYNTLSSFSNQSRAEAINSGSFIMDPFVASGTAQQVGDEINSQSSSDVSAQRYYTQPITDQERAEAESAKNPGGNSYITWSPSVLNMSANDAVPGDGYKKVNTDLLVIAIRIAKRLRATLYINSAYRSPLYNEGLRAAGNDGVAQFSAHTRGNALDVSTTNSRGLSNTDQSRSLFIQTASQEGVGGIGTYSTFIHIDIEQRRSWGSQQTQALGIHNRDEFRLGPLTPTPPQTVTT